MSLLEALRGYTLREYAVVLLMATLGGLGLVFMLSTMSGGGPGKGETLLKREPAARKETASVRFVEATAQARARTEAIAARRAKIRAARQLAAVRAARARATAARRSASDKRTVVRTTPRDLTPAPTRIVNPTPTRPTPRPTPAPKPTPKPQKSGASGGGGGAFDDSG